MNHSAFELCRPSEGLLKAFRRPSGVEITPFSFFFGHPWAHARISSGLTGTCSEMAELAKCSGFAISIHRSWFVASGCERWLQDSNTSVCAKFGKQRFPFKKTSSQSSNESEWGVNQGTEKMPYTRYDWTKLVISYSIWLINLSDRSPMMHQTILPC